MQLSIRTIPHGSSEYRSAVDLREKTLRIPLGLTFSKDELAQEKDHVHFGAYLGDKIIATAMLVSEGSCCKIQRVAVRADFQNQGVGSKLLLQIEREAKNRGFTTIYCSARDQAVQFYEKHGYIRESAYFVEDSIPHAMMRKLLALDMAVSSVEEKAFIGTELGRFNRQALGLAEDSKSAPLNFVIKDKDRIVAGIVSNIYWKVLHVEQLFVDESFRKHRLGSFLLSKVEREAEFKGAKLVHLDTFDFQAKDFYLKLGYKIFGTLDNCPWPGHQRFYLKKVLPSS